jgi:hypothetical protein
LRCWRRSCLLLFVAFDHFNLEIIAMKSVLKTTAVLGLLAATVSAAWAQGFNRAEYLDFSTPSLIAADDAKKIMDSVIPEKVWKIYSPKKFVFISQVEGGITPTGICAVTARVMLMPLTPTAKAVLFRPRQVATAFDAVPSSTEAQCKATAAEKLKEATTAVVSSLVKS